MTVMLALDKSSAYENASDRFTYTFMRSVPTERPLWIRYAVSGDAVWGDRDSSGRSSGDYAVSTNYVDQDKKAGWIQIHGWSISTTLVIVPIGDSQVEPDERVSIQIVDPTGLTNPFGQPAEPYAIGTNAPVTGTILNDDYVVDLVLDSLPEETQAKPNEMSPGAFLPIGSERQRLELNVVAPPGSGKVWLDVVGSAGANMVTLWSDPTDVSDRSRATTTTWDYGSQPASLWVQAMAPSIKLADVTFTLAFVKDTVVLKRDVAKATTVAVDIDVDSNNDGTVDHANAPGSSDDSIEADASRPGVIIPVGAGTRVPMIVEAPLGRPATLALNPDAAGRVRVYAQSSGGRPLSFTAPLAGGGPTLDLTRVASSKTGTATKTWTLWLDATAASTTMADIVMTISTSFGSGLPFITDTARATAVDFGVYGPGDIDADTARGWVTALVSPDDDNSANTAAEGLPVEFRVFRNGIPSLVNSVVIADGGATIPVLTSTRPGDTYRVEGWFAGQTIGVAEFPIVAGAPASIVATVPFSSVVADGQRVISVTAEIRDRHGNRVEDGTPVEWLLEDVSSSFASLPSRFSSVTTGGQAEVSFTVPDTPSTSTLRILSGSAVQTVEIPATFTAASLTGPTSLDLATSQRGTVTLTTDASDGTPVFWTISNGDVRTYEGLASGGIARLDITASGVWGRVGPCVVTATVGGRLAYHTINFYSSDPFFLEIDRFVLCGDKTEDGTETLHFPGVTPLAFAPSVVPASSRAVPYPAIATVTIHGSSYGTYLVEFADSISQYLAEIVGLDPWNRVQLSGNGTATVQLRSTGQFDGDPRSFDFAAVSLRVRPDAGPGMLIAQNEPSQARVVTAQFVEHTWYTRTFDAVQSFFGGDPQTGAGVAANMAGGMLIVGDAGSLVKNAWRAVSGASDKVNYVEVSFGSLGLVTEFAFVVGELADAPISGVKSLVAALANVPAGQILPMLYRRALSNGADMATLLRFIGRISGETAFHVVKNVLTSEDLIKAAIKATDDLGDAVFDGLKYVSAQAFTGGIAGAQRVLLVLANLSDAAKAELKLIAKGDFPVLCEHLGFILKSGTVDAALLSKVLAKDALFIATYNRFALLRDLRTLHAANRLDVMVRAVAGATLPNFIRGNLYEIQAAAAIMRNGGTEMKIFREVVNVGDGKTDIDFIIDGVYYQAKSGKVTMPQAKDWVKKAIEHAKDAGNNSPVIKYVMPQSAIDATPQKVKVWLKRQDIQIVPFDIP